VNGPTILVESLSLSFGRKQVLEGVSFEAQPGVTLGLIGPNGAGKTTLVGCLLGLLRPDSGRVRIDGVDPRDPRARRGLGHVPERSSFDSGRSARANLGLHHALAGLPSRNREAELTDALDTVGLANVANETVRHFSKGMLQRLSFAAALLGEPRWLVLDEPFSGVDPAGVALLRELILNARERGATIVLNSHRLDQVDRLCDRIALIANGRIRCVEHHEPGSAGGDKVLEQLVLRAAAEEGRR